MKTTNDYIRGMEVALADKMQAAPLLAFFASLVDAAFAGDEDGRADRIRSWFQERRDYASSGGKFSKEAVAAWRALSPEEYGNVHPNLRVTLTKVCIAFVGNKSFSGGAVDQFFLKSPQHQHRKMLEDALDEVKQGR